MARPRRFAVGDPQAPFSRFLAVLARKGLIGPGGSLADDVFLISLGDHFDYGSPDERQEAAHSGVQLLRWLASHPPDQVALVAGNHDLGRVGELAEFTEEAFERARLASVAAYRGGDVDAELERGVLERFPALPSAELAARDFAAFTVEQRALVTELLRSRRLRLAYAEGERLFCHAGITTDYLAELGLPHDAPAREIADALNRRLDDALAAWTSGALSIPGIHRPGSALAGEGVGMLYHRPANPSVEANRGYAMHGTLRRRYDARRIPLGLTQVVGHIGDGKCRALLGPWADDAEPRSGVVRSMVTDGVGVHYAHGLPEAIQARVGTMIFIDGGMNRALEDYELLRV